MLPAILLLLLLTLYPLLYGIWISFFNKHSFFPEQNFVGLANYTAVFADEEFWRALKLGLIYSLSTIALQLALGTAAALLLNEAFVGRGLVRAVAIFPYVIPTVVAVVVWKWLLNSQFGVVNYLPYTFTARLSTTTRLEFFNDAQGQRTGFPGLYTAATAGVTFKPNKYIALRPEVRYDYNGESRPFEGKHDVFTAAMDLLVRW